jgi:hemoglobin
MKAFREVVALVCAVMTMTLGCAGSSTSGSMTMDKKSLYDRLGGKPAISAVVDDFIGNVASDARINQRFAGANIPRLKAMLVDQICEASGGPCKYMGTSMEAAHRGMRITDADFGALVEDLVKSLDKFKVPAPEKGELLGALGGMKPQIVGQ